MIKFLVDFWNKRSREPTFPAWINSELHIKSGSDEMIVVLSQKKSFAFYNTEFHCSTLHIADQEDAYFAHGADDTAAAILAIVSKLRVERVLFLGCSKGGFGALLMAKLCAAKDRRRPYSCLCFSPQTRIYPENSHINFPSYKKLVREAATEPSLAADLGRYGDVTHVPPAVRATIVFGDLNAGDRSEAESVSGTKVSLVRLPLETHSVVLPFLVDNRNWVAVTEIVQSLTNAAARQEDLRTSVRSSAMIEEILALPRTRSLQTLCREAFSASNLNVFDNQSSDLDVRGRARSSESAADAPSSLKKAMWITCGIRGNAGDALLYQVTQKLFNGLVDLDFRYVGEPEYIRRGEEAPRNVMIGPGGMFVQTNSSRHLHRKLTKQWDQFEGSKFFLWSTGILTKPTDEEATSVRRVIERCPKVVVRANREAEFIRSVVPEARPEWSPCASLFTDTLLDIKARKRDVVVLNLDSFLFNEENFQDHPLRRFRAYAESEGLEVRSMINASGDHNKYLLELFPPIDIDLPLFEAALRDGVESKEFNIAFNHALQRHPSFAARYLDCRFAFGKRLHAWLPFLSFDVPAAFIGMKERRGMPKDYFGSDTLLCDVPRHPNMTREQLDQMAEGMIDKLKFFIGEESQLISSIGERRSILFDKLRKQAAEYAEILD